METCLNYCDDKFAYFSSDETKWINKITQLHEENPDEVQIIAKPNANDRCIYARFPVSYFKIAAKRTRRKMTEEEREAAKERGRQLAKTRKEKLAKEREEKRGIA